MRLLPATVGSRLTLTVLVTNLVVVGITSLILAIAWSANIGMVEDEAALDAVHHLRKDLSVGIADNERLTGALAESNLIYGAAGDPVSLEPARRFFEHSASLADATASVWVGADGVTLATTGAATVVQALEALTRDVESDVTVSGVAGLPGDRLVYVSVQPVTGWPTADPLGVVAIAAPANIIEHAGRSNVRFSAMPPKADGSAEARIVNDGDDTVRVQSLGDRTVLVHSPLAGVDSKTIGWIGLSLSSPLYENAAGLLGYTLLVALGTATIAGLLVGIGMNTLVKRPFTTVAERFSSRGHAALDGVPTRLMPDDPFLPVEFSDLASVFEGLLEHLARRQAALVEAEAEAEAAARDLALAVNDSSESKILIRGDRVVVVNPAASAVTGMPLDRLLGNVDEVFGRLALRSESGEPLARGPLIESALRRPTTIRVDREDGSTRYTELRAVERGETPAEHTLLLTARDITEERRVELLRDEVVMLVSHDLRAPLSVITGYLELLGRPLEESQRERAATAALVAAERMQELIEDILNVTRAEELFAPASLAPVDLSALAEDAVSALAHTTTHRMRACANAPGIALGEERRLRQALVNLLTNAIRHTPEPGEIEVTVEERDGCVLVAVEDSGPGIPESDRTAIFERFTRLDAGMSSSAGFGLGLYIVRAIAESHGGRVYAEDRASGPGTRFVLRIPSADSTSDAG